MEVKECEQNVAADAVPCESAVQKLETKRNLRWPFDREMLRFKLHYFLIMGGLSIGEPYITIFGKNRIDISASSMALILIIQHVLFIFFRPIIGFIADYFNKLKVIICTLTTIQTVFMLMLLMIPKIQKQEVQINNPNFLNTSEYLNSSNLYANCPPNRNDGLVSEWAMFFQNNNGSEYCFLSLDYLSEISDECSNQGGEVKNISKMSNLNNKTEHFLFSEEYENQTSSISIHFPVLATCTVCCESSKMCRNIECEIPNDNRNTIPTDKNTVSDFETYQFWIYALLNTIALGCIDGLFTLSDTACCESVERVGAQFGRQRLFGAIGWGLMSPLGGLLNDYTGDFTAPWILMAVLWILSLPNMLRLDLAKPKFSENLLKDIGSVLRSKKFLFFNLCVLFNGVCSGVLWYYLVWHLTAIGGSHFLCGLVQAVQCCFGEIPCMFYADWVIKKIGHFNIVTLSLTCYCLRFFWYSQLSNPWLTLPVECLSGVTYGLFYTAVVSYAKRSAKPGTEATTQGVLYTVHEAIGAAIGCLVAGIGFDTIGGHSTFFYLSVFAGCSMVLSIILQLVIRGRKLTSLIKTLT